MMIGNDDCLSVKKNLILSMFGPYMYLGSEILNKYIQRSSTHLFDLKVFKGTLSV